MDIAAERITGQGVWSAEVKEDPLGNAPVKLKYMAWVSRERGVGHDCGCGYKNMV